MKEYTEDEYKATFGEQMWKEKVLDLSDNKEIDSVYATDNGNIFMIMHTSNY